MKVKVLKEILENCDNESEVMIGNGYLEEVTENKSTNIVKLYWSNDNCEV